MGVPDPEATRQVARLAVELQESLQRLFDGAGHPGRVLVSPYRDAGGNVRVLVNMGDWQAVTMVGRLADAPPSPSAV